MELANLLEERAQARAARDWALSDALRTRLADAGRPGGGHPGRAALAARQCCRRGSPGMTDPEDPSEPTPRPRPERKPDDKRRGSGPSSQRTSSWRPPGERPPSSAGPGAPHRAGPPGSSRPDQRRGDGRPATWTRPRTAPERPSVSALASRREPGWPEGEAVSARSACRQRPRSSGGRPRTPPVTTDHPDPVTTAPSRCRASGRGPRPP